MEMTLDELAARSGMTPRNIREWQTHGLLPPPERRGRIGIYSADHLSRIERIKSLRAEGVLLDVIGRILDRSEQSAAGVRGLAIEMLDPTNHGGSSEMKRTELARRFGDDAQQHLVACGLITAIDDDLVNVTDTVTFEHLENLVAIGLPLEQVTTALSAMASYHVASVQTLVDLYREQIWQPFVEAGLPSEQWHAIADKTSRVRPAVIGLGMQAFRRAIDEVVGKAAVEEAAKLDDAN